ncbi:hypothetical protein SAMN04489835_4005 [Mycolicibacterium rutilum]|uniref:Uncharacterized protein n=1 Tax=Mycolicibacterium rutilum TaxID=370526 RepID=A0A1H6KPL3_MYCRU|nr:hypothetical protein [Mycolicibacterium rutilum]SEH77689.1 hypothetical protein SAMN04489835_4005 [Mycolicibacterium rutilum]
MIDARKLSVVGAGMAAALMAGMPSALADPVVPVPAPPPPPAPIVAAAAPAPAPDPLAFLRPAPPAAPAPAPVPAAPAAAPLPGAPAPAPADAPLPTPPEGVSHLASPDALPPGTTLDPTVKPLENPNVSYLKDLWHAVQNQEISGKEALIMGLAQRGMNTPYPDQAPGPNVPIAPVDPAAAPPPPPPAPALPWLPPPAPAPIPAPPAAP